MDENSAMGSTMDPPKAAKEPTRKTAYQILEKNVGDDSWREVTVVKATSKPAAIREFDKTHDADGTYKAVSASRWDGSVVIGSETRRTYKEV